MSYERKTPLTSHCLFCGKPFAGPLPTRSDKEYCNSTCRSRAYLSSRRAMGRDVMAILRGKPVHVRWQDSPVWHDLGAPGRGEWAMRELQREAETLAASVEATVNAPTTWEGKIALIKAERPEAFASFGLDVLTAAAAPVPPGYCRPCYALTMARAHNRPIRIDKTALDLLGGKLCDRCQPIVSPTLTASAAPPATLDRPAVGHDAATCFVHSRGERARMILATKPGTDVAGLRRLVALAEEPHEYWRGKCAKIEPVAGTWRTKFERIT